MIRSIAGIVSKNVGRNINFSYIPILSKMHLRHIPALQNRNFSQRLKRHPLPPLYNTMETYVRSCLPFLTKAEYERTKKLAVELAAPGEDGETLQKYLEDRAKTTENWIADWLINVAYLEYRNPLVLWSSVAQTLPIQKPFNEEEARLYYAARVILAALDFKKKVDEGKLKTDKRGKHDLDMQQYSKIFGTNRKPILSRDCMTYNPDAKHIVVAYKNNFYAVNVIGSDCSRSSPDVEQMKSLLQEIVDNTKRVATPIGHLTSNDRDSWAKARQNLMEHPMNVESISLIENALFLVCLDEGLDSVNSHDDMTRGAEQLMHGGGVCHNSANRWFDKSIQFVISMDGISGLIVEQSTIEGETVANMVDYIVKNVSKNKQRLGTECFPTPKHLCFCYNNEAKQSIEVAAEHINALVQDIDIWCFKFDNFGKNFLKEIYFSPNSFLQMAIQYAYYRMHCKHAATYSPGIMRMFLHGRTDVVRSCSMQSLNFVRSMVDKDECDLYRMICLKEAADHYREYKRMTEKGGGIDRHLLGIRMAAQAMSMKVPALFKDEAFKRSSHMILNTARVMFKCDAVMCLGPMVLDGYGVCYNLRNESINVSVSCLKSNKETNSREFLEGLVLSIIDMKDLIIRVDRRLKNVLGDI